MSWLHILLFLWCPLALWTAASCGPCTGWDTAGEQERRGERGMVWRVVDGAAEERKGWMRKERWEKLKNEHWDTWLKTYTTIGHIKHNVISSNAPDHMSKATTYVNDILPLLQIGGTVVLDLYHMEQVLVQSTRDRHLQTHKHTSSTDTCVHHLTMYSLQ